MLDVRLVPRTDSCTAEDIALFDHLVGAGEKRWRNLYAELFRRLEINHQLELGGLHNRKFGRLFTLKDASDINACLSPCVR